jgi:hypothetical protein
MVSFLQKLTGAKSCFRPQLEKLEDRLTPAGLNFIPVAHVAVNPQPLPPGGGAEITFPGVYLEEVPLVTNPIPGVSSQTENLVGVLSKQIAIQPGATDRGNPGPWFLEAFYNLTVNDTVTVTPPDPASGQEGVSASFSMTGALSEILIPPGPAIMPTTFLNGTMTETGTLDGALSPSDPTSGTRKLIGRTKYSNINLERGTVLTPGLANWYQQVQGNSQVNLEELVPPASATVTTASFWEQGEVLINFLAGNPDSPVVLGTIDATFIAGGSAMLNVFYPPGPPNFHEIDAGTTQYTDSLTETMMMSDGSMQTLTQDSLDNGTFIIAILIG